MKVYLQLQSKHQLGNLASLPPHSRAATSKPRQQVSNCNVASKYLSESLAVACPIYSPHLSSNSITAQSKNVSQNTNRKSVTLLEDEEEEDAEEEEDEEEEEEMKEQFLLISHCFCVKGFL